MKLYLQIDRPGGKRVGYLDGKLKPQAGYVLFPDRAVEVPDVEANRILAANRSLVGLEPYKRPEPKPEPAPALTPTLNQDSVAMPKDSRKASLLKKLADIDFLDLTVAEMNVYFQSLEVEVPRPSVGKEQRAKLLEKACAEAVKTL